MCFNMFKRSRFAIIGSRLKNKIGFNFDHLISHRVYGAHRKNKKTLRFPQTL